MRIMHLHDLSLGSRRVPACNEVSDNIATGDKFDKFDKAKPEEVCTQCVVERAYELIWERTCVVCGQLFSNLETAHEHRQTHYLKTASYRKEPVAFVLNTQNYYDDSYRKARSLARAFTELKVFHSRLSFETVPSRMELTKEGQNGVMLGEAHIVDYLFIQK